jgi:hypothetical protein
MLKKPVVLLFIVYLLIAWTAIAGVAQTSKKRLPSNQELVSRAKSVYVDSDTFYMKKENLESSLLGREEFKAWEIQITGQREFADLVISVRRVPFRNHFMYTVTDTETNTIVMAGKVDSLAGTVYGLIADEIVHKMKVFRGDPLAGIPPPKS